METWRNLARVHGSEGGQREQTIHCMIQHRGKGNTTETVKRQGLEERQTGGAVEF